MNMTTRRIANLAILGSLGVVVVHTTISQAGIIDERTQRATPPAMQTASIGQSQTLAAAPATSAATAPVRLPAVTPAPEPSAAPKPLPAAEGSSTVASPAPTSRSQTSSPYTIDADLSTPAWSAPYPGPFGSMPLADALIAQIAPVSGGAIELEVPEHLLSMSVTVARGLSRADTLRDMSLSGKMNLRLRDKKVQAWSDVTSARALESTSPSTSASTEKTVSTPEGLRITTISSSQGTQTASAPSASKAFEAPITPVEFTPPPPPPKQTKRWTMESGAMLSGCIEEWAKLWGWKLVWKVSNDFRIASPVEINDDFLGGIEKVLEAYRSTNNPLWGDAHEAQKLLVITTPNNNGAYMGATPAR